MPVDLAIVLLFSVATGVAVAARRIGIPYSVALALTGVALGATHVVGPDLLRRDLLFSLFLPGLVFEAAYRLELTELRRQAWALVALAVPGVAFGALATALLLVLARPFLGLEALPFPTALVFGAIVAATDPVAVVAIFRGLGAPRSLCVRIEGESLVNDGTGIAVFVLAVAMATSDHASYGAAAIGFLRILTVGVTVGAAFGFATSAVSRRIDDAMIEVTLTVIAAYGSFALAEHAGGSGVLAAVTAGIFCGNHGEAAMSERTRHAVSTFWSYLAFAFDSLIFLSMGFAVHAPALASSWRAIVFAYLALLTTRSILVSGVTLLLARTRSAIPWREAPVLVWGGIRGALSMVLALSLPESFPQRETLIALTTGVVMVTLVVQGTSMSWLARRLGLLTETREGRA